MDKNSLLGFLVLFALLMGYLVLSSPSKEEIDRYNEELQAYNDSLILAHEQDSIKRIEEINKQTQLDQDTTLTQAQKDSITDAQKQQEAQGAFGTFSAAAAAAKGNNKEVTLENDKLKIVFSAKGGRIQSVIVKDFLAYDHTTKEDRYDKKETVLWNNDDNKFNYKFRLASGDRQKISTEDLYFEPTQDGNTITFKAYASNKQQYIEQKYTLSDKGYILDYDLSFNGLNQVIDEDAPINLEWNSFLNRIEKYAYYERNMTSIHYKGKEESPSYCNCVSDAQEELDQKVHWVSHAQQFFNTSLITKDGTAFSGAKMSTVMSGEEATHLKELYSIIELPFIDNPNATYNMQMYIGPNDYDELLAMNIELERIIPFGWSIFGFISRSIIRPVFNLLAGFIPSYGLIILILTVAIRLLLFPMQKKMLVSSVKMKLLKPKFEAIKKKHKDNPQGAQMEQMRLYQEYGANPLGGCLPMVLTMPIWIALYRFFPASIEFRQKSFLWADDLVSYDSILDFNFNIPFYGDHVSLFTLLWCISMFAYLIYNSKQMDMSAAAGGGANMKMMKVMQFAFPVIFFFALNSWAAGLTAYMLFSNLMNIGQTFVTKNYLINEDKLLAQMEAKKKAFAEKGQKGGGMWAQYEEMAKQQQAAKKKKKKK
ncbi:MAG: membrane protein insertase YidC [Aureispira sp.]|nr:membrane protein insertase YidC [Aureispira sp.]